MTPSDTPTPPRGYRRPRSGVTCCGWMAGWPGSGHEHELLELSGLGDVLDATGVATLLDRGFRGLAKLRAHWHAPVGDRRTKDRLTDGQRTYNRVQAGLRARWWSSRSDIWQAPGRCAAGAGCCTGSGMSTGPLARSSASAGGSTGYPRDGAITETRIEHALLSVVAADYRSSSTDMTLPAGSLNHAMFGPPRKIPFSSVLRSPSL
jgi:hypothetical protein